MSTDSNSRLPKTRDTATNHRAFALVIGINKYQDTSYDSLKTAVNDANRFEKFLIRSLNVSPSDIISLRDEAATRENILAAFKSLISNKEITKDDPIIIYYAGHGGRVPKPVEWNDWPTTSPQIEIMCPTDMGISVDGQDPIDGIPDRTISVLLHKMSLVKGDNITLILDCCSSAGMSRGEIEPSEYIVRRIPDPPKMSPSCDSDIWYQSSTRGSVTLEGFSGKHHESHVLLAACGVNQFASENPRTGGLFTTQLLRILERIGITELTYTSLMDRLNMPKWQTPHCEGYNVDRRLFNKRAAGANRALSLGRVDDNNSMTLSAGDAQGVLRGSKYAIYPSNLNSDANKHLGTLIVDKVNAFSSTLIIDPDSQPFIIPDVFYAKKIQDGPHQAFGLFCEDKNTLETLFSGQIEALGISLTDDAESADMIISVVDGKVIFDRRDTLASPHIGSRFPYRIPVDDKETLCTIVSSAIHFKHHLTRSGVDMPNVWMELRELEVGEKNGFETQTPVGPNLFDTNPAHVIVDRLFGMVIHNQTHYALYPHVFFFDPTELQINSWYTPAIGGGLGRSDAPLPPKSAITLGYGDSATDPWTFGLRPGEHVDVGFFKIFLTTSPSDFSMILQDSPFESVDGLPMRYSNDSEDVEFWATKMMTVVQKAK